MIVEGGYFLSVVTIIMTVPKPIMALVIMLTRWYRSKTRMTELACYCLVGKIVSSKVDGAWNVRIYDFLVTERYVSINIFCEDLPTLVMSVYKSLRVEFVEISHVLLWVFSCLFKFRKGEANNWPITVPTNHNNGRQQKITANQSRLEAVTGCKEARETFTCSLRHWSAGERE